MLDFKSFRDGVGGKTVEKLTGTSIRHISSWRNLEGTIAAGFDELKFEKFIERSKRVWDFGSTSEVSLMLAIVFAIGYSHQLENITGTENPSIRHMFKTYGDYALACAACVAKID